MHYRRMTMTVAQSGALKIPKVLHITRILVKYRSSNTECLVMASRKKRILSHLKILDLKNKNNCNNVWKWLYIH